jgi:hypothetical protein
MMFVSNIVLPALAVAGFAAAQSTKCTDSKTTFTLSSPADATSLASSCSTISGNIAVASSVSGPMDLSSIQKIKGDLSCVGAVNLTSLTADSLTSIGGDFTLTSLIIMSNLAFPKLTSVGAIKWTTLNALQQLTFTAGLDTADTVVIGDTQLNSLNGINLETVESLNINNNNYLQLISTQISSITGSLNIDSNGNSLVVEFPNLENAFNMTIRNISSISIPSLKTVNSTLGFYGDLLESISAPNLTTVSGDLAVVANPSLTNISMPLLKTVGGGFQVANNTKLLKIDSFPKLESTGAINFSGNFTDVQLPKLKDVKGAFNMQSSGNFSCDPFDEYKADKVIKGSDYTCVSKSNNVQASGTGTSTTSSPSSTGTGNAAVMNSADMPVLMGVLALVGGIFQLV